MRARPRPALVAAALAAGLVVGVAVHLLGERTGSGWALVDDLASGVVLALVLVAGASLLRRDGDGAKAPSGDTSGDTSGD